MAKFSSARAGPNAQHVVTTTAARVPTYEDGVGYGPDPKSELFLLAVSNLVSEKTFYESASDRDDRFEQLVAKVTVEDPDWVRRMIPWLRSTSGPGGVMVCINPRCGCGAGDLASLQMA